MNKEQNLSKAAAKAGMCEKTARKYLASGQMPEDMKKEHGWRTRPDPFTDVWDEVRRLLEMNSGLQSKTLFEHLQRTYTGKFQDGQRRTLERRVREWRALEGPSKEVYFSQEHRPGELSASDFTDMNELNVTVNREAFKHLVFHFVLTYSNWETGKICYSEIFESLSEGIQNALWELGGVAREHLTDSLSAADQALMLRDSRDFSSVDEYSIFLKEIFAQLNAGRQNKFAEELKLLRKLPARRLESSRTIEVKVTKYCTIRVLKNVYSLDSRVIGERVLVRVHADELEVRYAGKLLEKLPRLRGAGKHHIQYRHIIGSLVKKSGAFRRYLYRDALFPTTYFKTAYDVLESSVPTRASKEYLKILHLAAMESEADTDNALRILINQDRAISFDVVREMVISAQRLPAAEDVQVAAVDLGEYDCLLGNEEAA